MLLVQLAREEVAARISERSEMQSEDEVLQIVGRDLEDLYESLQQPISTRS